MYACIYIYMYIDNDNKEHPTRRRVLLCCEMNSGPGPGEGNLY